MNRIASVANVLLWACSPIASEVALQISGQSVSDRIGWTTWDEGGFTVQTSPRMFGRSWGGFDSEGGSWSEMNATASYDLGSYSNPLTAQSLSWDSAGHSVSECTDTPEGSIRTVLWQRGEDGEFVGAHWGELTLSVQLSDSVVIHYPSA